MCLALVLGEQGSTTRKSDLEQDPATQNYCSAARPQQFSPEWGRETYVVESGWKWREISIPEAEASLGTHCNCGRNSTK